MRKPFTDKLVLHEQRKKLKIEVMQAEDRMELAREQNDLEAYEQAKKQYDVAMEDLEAVIADLHPHTPREWMNQYGDVKPLTEFKKYEEPPFFDDIPFYED
jgi:hypothetical protein